MTAPAERGAAADALEVPVTVCEDCGAAHASPPARCESCGSKRLADRRIAGRGRLVIEYKSPEEFSHIVRRLTRDFDWAEAGRL